MEPPRPVPRNRGISADNVPNTSLADHHAHMRAHSAPVPRPRQRNQSSGSDPIAEEEDIYTDNSSPSATNQNAPSKRVAWGEVISIDDEQSLPAEGPSSTGFLPRPVNAKPGWSGQSVQSLTGQMGAMTVGPSNEQGLTQKELDIQRREADLQRREERLRSEQSDREFTLTERERDVQHREDAVHMREKEVKQKEFDLLNSDLGDAGERLAEIAAKETAVESRSRDLDARERQLDSRERHLQDWDLHLKQRESAVSQREAAVAQREAEVARSPVYQQPPQQSYQYPPAQHPYTQQFVDYPPQGGQQYYNPPQGFGPQPQARQHAYTQPQPIQPSQQPTYAPQSPPNLPPQMQSPRMPPVQPTHPRAGGAALPAPLVTPKQRVSVDEEIATALQRAVPQQQTQIDTDAEMAKKLLEEEEQEWKAKLEMDAQIALLMQHQEVEGQEDSAVPQDFTATVDTSNSSAQEAIQKRIQEQLAKQREMEEADRRLAEQLAKEGETDNIPAPNNLDA